MLSSVHLKPMEAKMMDMGTKAKVDVVTPSMKLQSTCNHIYILLMGSSVLPYSRV